MEAWHRLKFFNERENWGNSFKIEESLVLKLDLWREKIGSRVIITSGTQGKHVENSYHYKGMAADCLVPDTELHSLDLYIEAVRAGFGGIGYYTNWRYGKRIVPGFHLDIRERFATWLGVFDPVRSKRVYLAFNYKHLKEHRII